MSNAPMSEKKAIKVRYCNCVEVGIPENGIVMLLLKRHYPQAHWVEKCNHWETNHE